MASVGACILIRSFCKILALVSLVAFWLTPAVSAEEQEVAPVQPAFANYFFGEYRFIVRGKTEQNVESRDFRTRNSTMIGKDEFQVDFLFLDDRLWRIGLIGPADGSEDVLSILRTRYGKPSYTKPIDAKTALWGKEGRRDGKGCEVQAQWQPDSKKVVSFSRCWRTEEDWPLEQLYEELTKEDPAHDTVWHSEIAIWDSRPSWIVEELEVTR